MRKLLFWIAALAVVGSANFLIFRKERVISEGVLMRLELSPVDPLSLLQGYYMSLDYALARGEAAEAAEKEEGDGCVVVRLSEDHVARYVRIYKDETLAAGEHLLRYRWRGYLKLGADAYFFQEDHAEYYENARYGEFRVNESGDSVLIGLCNESFESMRPPE